MLHNYLIAKLTVWNFALACFTFFLYKIGVLLPAFLEDSSQVSYLIASTFVVGLVSIFYFAWNFDAIDNIKIKFQYVVDIASYLVVFGLIGTSIGILHMVQGVDLSALGDSQKLGEMGLAMSGGLKTLSYCTILGAASLFWHSVNLRMLNTQIELAE